jgi:amicyanin
MNSRYTPIIVVTFLLVAGLIAYLATRPAHTTVTPSPSSSPTTAIASPTATLPATSTTPATTTNTVTIQDMAFAPSSLTVKKGATITWVNKDSAQHNVVTDEGQPAGGPAGPLLANGQTYSFTFNTAGTFKYHCQVHPSMHGTVIVTP